MRERAGMTSINEGNRTDRTDIQPPIRSNARNGADELLFFRQTICLCEWNAWAGAIRMGRRNALGWGGGGGLPLDGVEL